MFKSYLEQKSGYDSISSNNRTNQEAPQKIQHFAQAQGQGSSGGQQAKKP